MHVINLVLRIAMAKAVSELVSVELRECEVCVLRDEGHRVIWRWLIGI
jgi:hypothetical protein